MSGVKREAIASQRCNPTDDAKSASSAMKADESGRYELMEVD
jgi:hypothetical protein